MPGSRTFVYDTDVSHIDLPFCPLPESVQFLALLKTPPLNSDCKLKVASSLWCHP